jgi:hypothetical protein
MLLIDSLLLTTSTSVDIYIGILKKSSHNNNNNNNIVMNFKSSTFYLCVETLCLKLHERQASSLINGMYDFH